MSCTNSFRNPTFNSKSVITLTPSPHLSLPLTNHSLTLPTSRTKHSRNYKPTTPILPPQSQTTFQTIISLLPPTLDEMKTSSGSRVGCCPSDQPNWLLAVKPSRQPLRVAGGFRPAFGYGFRYYRLYGYGLTGPFGKWCVAGLGWDGDGMGWVLCGVSPPSCS